MRNESSASVPIGSRRPHLRRVHHRRRRPRLRFLRQPEGSFRLCPNLCRLCVAFPLSLDPARLPRSGRHAWRGWRRAPLGLAATTRISRCLFRRPTGSVSGARPSSHKRTALSPGRSSIEPFALLASSRHQSTRTGRPAESSSARLLPAIPRSPSWGAGFRRPQTAPPTNPSSFRMASTSRRLARCVFGASVGGSRPGRSDMSFPVASAFTTQSSTGDVRCARPSSGSS